MPSLKAIISHKNLFLFGLFLVAVGMPMSKFLMSLGQFVLLGNWILEGEWKRKWQVMKTSKVLWVLSSFYFLHLLGLLWTSDFNYAANDLRIKLPLLWFPLLFATSKPIGKKEIDALLNFFIASAVLATLVSLVIWLGWTKKKITDIRDISIFNSHIRFSLMIVLCICILLHDFLQSRKAWHYLLKTALIAWFIAFLFILESLTGILILCALCFILVVKHTAKKQNVLVKYLPFLLLVGTVLMLVFFAKQEWAKYNYRKKIDWNAMDKYTLNGNTYLNDTSYTQTENGNWVNIYVCSGELRTVWNRRSKLVYDEKDLKGNSLPITINRYLTSKGLRKDSVGLSSLTDEEIKKIEKGCTNYLYPIGSMRSRIRDVIYEYYTFRNNKNPSGHSLVMRLEFWRTGIIIIRKHLLFGVGTGDLQQEYNAAYQQQHSRLDEKWRLRSHNQFIAVTLAFGLTGLFVFLLWLFYPLALVQHRHKLFGIFLLIVLFSMLTEDTLESQAGVTFFGFFYSFFLFNTGKISGNETKK